MTGMKQKRMAALGIALVILALFAPLICVSVLAVPLLYDEDISRSVTEGPELWQATSASAEKRRFCARPSSDTRLQSGQCNRESPA